MLTLPLSDKNNLSIVSQLGPLGAGVVVLTCGSDIEENVVEQQSVSKMLREGRFSLIFATISVRGITAPWFRVRQ
jgi:hypothetical protein